jgi:TM2 domain-containing membrane protein YozV
MKLYNNSITYGDEQENKAPSFGNGPEGYDVISSKSWTTTLLLSIFLGGFGAHRFYVGKVGTGVLMIFLSVATLGIWPLIDLILIATGKFTDASGKLITEKKMGEIISVVCYTSCRCLKTY